MYGADVFFDGFDCQTTKVFKEGRSTPVDLQVKIKSLVLYISVCLFPQSFRKSRIIFHEEVWRIQHGNNMLRGIQSK